MFYSNDKTSFVKNFNFPFSFLNEIEKKSVNHHRNYGRNSKFIKRDSIHLFIDNLNNKRIKAKSSKFKD